MSEPRRHRVTFRVDLRCHSILESVRDENLLPNLNAALNFLIRDYRRLQESKNGFHGTDPKLTAK